MSSQDRLFALLEAAHDRLDHGDLAGARAKHAQAERLDGKDPDVRCLGAQLIALDGDLPEAYEQITQVIAAHPEHIHSRLAAADFALGLEPEEAVEHARAALELIDDDGDLIAAILLLADGLVQCERPDEAREALAELASSAIDEPSLILDVAHAHLNAGDPTTSELWARRALDEDGYRADAFHVIGACREAKGDKGGMVAAWREVLGLDRAELWEPVVAVDEFERIAAAALGELPEEVRAHLTNVPILIEDLPSDHLVEDGMDPRLMGVFEGTPLPEQSAVGGVPTITTIHLFRKNLERAGGGDADTIAEEIRTTVLHETAHFFGLDEDQVAELGLD